MASRLSVKMRHAIIPNAGMPNQCELMDRATSPLNKKAMAWPIPQPGHQVMPKSFKGQSVK